MKMGFIFNIRFPYYQGNYYAVDLPGDVWKKRYLNYCDEIKVIGRRDRVGTDPSGKLGLSNIDRVKFACVENEPYVKRFFHHGRDSRHILSEIKDCDFVICRGSWGVRECRESGIPYLVELVGCDWDALWNHSWQGKIAALPRFIALKRAVKHAPYVLYVTEKFLQGRYPTRGKQAGISDVKLQPAGEEVLAERMRRIASRSPGDKLVIGTTAAVNVKYKGQQFVIAALGMLKKRGIRQVEYQLVGGGDPSYLRGVAEQYGVADQVVFKGPMPHDKVFQWLDSIDVYVQPSLQEGLPRAVVEAMSRGCPVFGAATGGIPELVDPSFVFKRKNARQIADMLGRFDRATMKKEAQRSFEKAKDYDPRELDQRRDAFYREFIRSQVTERSKG